MSLHRMLRAAAGRNSTPVANTDPQFNYVSLLLHGDGTNGAQNNTFLDSSSNAFSITRNGNTTQGSLSPYGNLWSNYFDGTGDWLTASSSAAFDFGTGDFTIEFFANLFLLSTGYVHLFNGTYSVLNQYLTVRFGDFGFGYKLQVSLDCYSLSTVWSCSLTQAQASNGWIHIAFTRSSGVCRLFVNGVLQSLNNGANPSTYPVTSFTDNTNLTSNTGVKIGDSGVIGHMSNVRVVKGTAVYTSNFTPPTAPLTAISGTSLLTCQSNRFRDASANNFTITRTGDVRVTKEAPFLPTAAYSTSVIGGSGYFDGTGDYLTVANNSAFNLDTGDYTVEFWFNVDTVASVTYSILGPWSYPNGWLFQQVNNAINFYGNGGNISGFHTSGPILRANEWTHVAVTRSGSTSRMFVNGALVSSTSVSIGASSNMLGVGINPQGLNEPFKGYLSNLRIVKGTAVYTAAFTPPTAPVTAISGTSLLLNFTNAGIFDNAAENVLETVGNAQISTSVKKYGTGSLAFDGNGDSINALSNTNLQLRTGDFTIEMWVYKNNNSGYQTLAAKWSPNDWGLLWYPSTTSLQFAKSISGGYTTIVSDPSAFPTSQWVHVAVTRASGTTRLFINGTVVSTASDTNDYFTTQLLSVGTLDGASFPLNGYIDDLRITKGYARYTANFTPPTAAFPDQ